MCAPQLTPSTHAHTDPDDGQAKSPPPGAVNKQYGLMWEIKTPRELRGLTRRWLPSQQQSSSHAQQATQSSKYAFGSAFHGLLQRLRRKLMSMRMDDYADLSQNLRKIDGKVKGENYLSLRFSKSALANKCKTDF